MRELKKGLVTIVSIGLVSAPACTAIQTFSKTTGLIMFIFLAAAFLLYLITPRIRRFHTAGIQVEIWERDIVGNLFKNNDFLLQAYNADQYVLQGKVVHIMPTNMFFRVRSYIFPRPVGYRMLSRTATHSRLLSHKGQTWTLRMPWMNILPTPFLSRMRKRWNFPMTSA